MFNASIQIKLPHLLQLGITRWCIYVLQLGSSLAECPNQLISKVLDLNIHGFNLHCSKTNRYPHFEWKMCVTLRHLIPKRSVKESYQQKLELREIWSKSQTLHSFRMVATWKAMGNWIKFEGVFPVQKKKATTPGPGEVRPLLRPSPSIRAVWATQLTHGRKATLGKPTRWSTNSGEGRMILGRVRHGASFTSFFWL